MFDPIKIVEVLLAHDVAFVVIGGFAAELYQVPVPPTQDIDVTPQATQQNLSRLSAALEELGARIFTAEEPAGLAFAHDAQSLARAEVWNLTCRLGRLDISFHPDGTEGYDDLAERSVRFKFGRQVMDVAALADVVRSKRAAGRPKDLSTLPMLVRWLEVVREVSPEALRADMARVVAERQKLHAGGEEPFGL